MWYWHEDASWLGWGVSLITMLIFWGTLLWALWLFLRTAPGRGGAAAVRSPEQVLADRFASGELDADAYHHGLDVLAGRGRTVAPH